MSLLDDLIGQVLDEKYCIDRKLGQGGMGAVYRASHLGTDRPVALKVIAPEFMSEHQFVERFRREAKAAGRLRHPNVVNVTDFGFAIVNGQRIAYLVMEYLDGSTLGDLLAERKRLPLPLVVDIIEQTCIAIAEAHQQGIIHRDLKPDNIWLQPDGRGGYNVKVLDFGLAKLHAPQTNQSSVTGKLILGSSNIKADIDAKTFVGNNVVDVNAITAGRDNNSSLPEITVINDDEITTQIKNNEDATKIKHNTKINDDEVDTKISDPMEAATMVAKHKVTADQKNIYEHQNSALTRVGSILGTPLYMSPEQCLGRELDTRSDIYSLAVIVYEMLSGAPPFRGSIKQLIEKHTKEAPVPLERSAPQLPRAITRLVMTALAKDAKERPPSATAFAAALRANSEAEMPILREALALYRQQWRKFLPLSLMVQLPVFILSALVIIIGANFAPHSDAILKNLLLKNWYWIVCFIMLLGNSSLAVGAFAYSLTHHRSGNASTGDIINNYYRNLGRIFAVLIKVVMASLAQSVKFILPGIRKFINLSLFAPVTILENSYLTSLPRAESLAQELSGPLLAVQIRSLSIIGISLLSGPTLFVLISLFASLLGLESDPSTAIKFNLFAQTWLSGLLLSLFPALIMTIAYPFIGIALSICYFKARRIKGERCDYQNIVTYRQQMSANGTNWLRASLLMATLLLLSIGWLAFLDRFLLFAASNGFIKMASALVLVGANVNAPVRPELFNNYHTTALVNAVGADESSMVDLLLTFGANVNSANEFGWTPLNEAIKQEQTDLAILLISRGANVNSVTSFFWTPLMVAAEHGNLKIVKTLLNSGATVNSQNSDEETALMIAIRKGQAYIVPLLLAKGADVNIADEDGNTALILAVRGGDSYLVKLLLNASADIQHKNSNGDTPLSEAMQRENKEIIELLNNSIPLNNSIH